ncbi:hypothetical protein FIBSPDRAFT_945583 [Athelia psychrophila]|uniref:TPR-like protein n=1 Tax=Athelia psychrophila TaxID=1759441 RepID=A0A166TXV9_9AGAM|nr:hypothetical protein FIBSPDRAFT_945583 [Fibularhizoctonia sp. CBS 109695]
MVREFKTAPIHGTGYLARGELHLLGIPKVVGVSEQLLYSCESWIDHLVDIKHPDSAIMEGLQVLLSDHGTMWMEIVSSRSIFRGSLGAWKWLEGHHLHLKELPDDASRANVMFRLSYRLSSVWRHEEAMTAIWEAVDLYRALAADQPAVFNGPLATSLFNMSNRLKGVGRHEEAATAIREVVDLERALAADQPGVFNAYLADSLFNMSIRRTTGGLQWPSRRFLPQTGVFNGLLADCLQNSAIYLAALGRHEEAVTAILEAVDLCWALAAAQPEVFNSPLADSLENMPIYLLAVGRHEEALIASQQEADVRRALAAEHPAT